jgi:hypothetical protein
MTVQTKKQGRVYTVSATQNEYTFTAKSVVKSIAFKRAAEGVWKQVKP